jgi:hypothetical protein
MGSSYLARTKHLFEDLKEDVKDNYSTIFFDKFNKEKGINV